MKTKQILIVASFIINVSVGCATNVPDAKINFKIMDESGKPLANIPVNVNTLTDVKPGAGFGDSVYTHKIITTDDQGLTTWESPSMDGSFSFWVSGLPGYYKGGCNYRFEKSDLARWQPWNPTVELKLRSIGKPIPMYAIITRNFTLPEIGKSIGFDLMISDWVMPYGKGLKSDLIFHLDRKPDRTVKTKDYYKRDVKLFDATLTVSFSNPNDGIQPIPTNNEYIGCEFSIPRFAPESGYATNLIQRTYCESADQQIVSSTNEKLGYFYRVRTVKQNDKIVSSHYGKMGNINFGVIGSPTAIINFTYYLNPTPNDRNMEFDPKRNLFMNLNEFEQVTAP